MTAYDPFLPIDRRLAIASGQPLPDRTVGSALSADIVGFTPLTEQLARLYGRRRGADELSELLYKVYHAMINAVHNHHGSVIGFSGDAITCWFDSDDGRQAAACAITIQKTMQSFSEVALRAGNTISLAVKVAVVSGPVRRFAVGTPAIQIMDVLVGETMSRLAQAGSVAKPGEVVLGEEIVQRLGIKPSVSEWREATQSKEKFYAASDLTLEVTPEPWNDLATLTSAQIRSWLLPQIRERLDAGMKRFFAEIRPAIALFVEFSGFDYDQNDNAGDDLNEFICRVQSILNGYGGQLIQLTSGDKGTTYLYATFGGMVAHEDDATRAALAALKISGLTDELKMKMVRVGISQGLVYAGIYGSPERCTFGVFGTEVNLAARLMEEAGRGQIIVSRHFFEATAQKFRFKYQNSRKLKGLPRTIPLYQLLEKQPYAPAAKSPGLLIGRQRELRRIRSILNYTAKGNCTVLHLFGVPGIGKSQLKAEALQHASEQGFIILQSTCDPILQEIPLSPWKQIIKNLPDLAVTSPSELEDRLRSLNPEWLVCLPLLGEMLELPIPENQTTQKLRPSDRQAMLFGFVEDLIRHQAAASPLVIVLEDAHLLDEQSRVLTQHLLQWLNHERIAVFLVYRPGEGKSKRPLPNQQRPVTNSYIDLQPLSPKNITELASEQLPGTLSRLAMDLIQQQSKGNPLFTTEFIVYLRDKKQLVQTPNYKWDLVTDLVDRLKVADCIEIVNEELALKPGASLANAGLDLSDDLHRLVLSRLDRLPTDDRWILKIASFIGFKFDLELLHTCTSESLSGSELGNRLELLSAQNVLDPDLPGYSFHHPVIQESIHQGLTGADRRNLHEVVGVAFETLHPEMVETIAYHYGHCAIHDLENYQGEMKELRTRALRYLDLAASKHETQGAYQNALHSAQQALMLYKDDENLLGQARCLAIFGLIARRKGQYATARKHYKQALSLLKRADPPPLVELCKVYNGLGIVLRESAKYPQAKAAISKALSIAQATGNFAVEAESLNNLGVTLAYQQQYSEALSWHEKALAIRKDIQDLSGQGVSAYNISFALVEKGELSRAVEYLEYALEIQQQTGNHWEQVNVLNGLGIVRHQLGRLTEAEEAHERSIKLSRTLGDLAGVCYAQANLGALQIEQGLWGQAQTTLDAGLELARKLKDPSLEAYFWSQLSLLSLAKGDFEPALEQAKIALQIRQEIRERYLTADDLATMAVLNLRLERHADALKCAQRANALLDECQGEGPEMLPRDYRFCSLVFEANGLLCNAEATRVSAYNHLMQRADRITDKGARAYYLDQPDHRQIIADYLNR